MAKPGRGQAPPLDPLIGQTIAGTYEVVQRVGRGGMGTVYELRHRRTGIRFALKRVKANLADNAEVLARFRQECDILKGLKHRSIVLITDELLLDDGTPCMIMPFLEGEDLGKRLAREGPQPWPLIARVADDILDALWVAHGRGIIHRDLKPENIFLERDSAGREQPKLLDFGISKIDAAGAGMGTGDRPIGTPPYMAPEQWTNESIGPQTDVWAMGAILYTMATGRPPFGPDLGYATMRRIVDGGPEPWGDTRGDAPPAFREAVDGALARDPARRILHSDDLRERILEALRDLSRAPRRRPDAAPAPATTPPPSVTPQELPTPALAPEPSPAVTAARSPNPLPPASTTLLGAAGEARLPTIRFALPTSGPRRRRGLVTAGGLGIAAATVALVLSWRFAAPRPPASVATPASPPIVAPIQSASPVIAPPGPAAPTVEPAPPATVRLRIESRPPGAEVLREADGARLGVTPLEDERPRSPAKVAYRLRLRGHQDRRLEILARAGPPTVVELAPVSPAAPLPVKRKRQPDELDQIMKEYGKPGVRPRRPKQKTGDGILHDE